MVLLLRAFIRRRVISMATTATSFALAQDSPRTHHLHEATAVQDVADGPEHSEELSENVVAMIADIPIKPTDDIDRAFVGMMAPRHNGAVDMAKAELKSGRNKQLRLLAQEIVANQQQRFTMLRNAVNAERSFAVQPPE